MPLTSKQCFPKWGAGTPSGHGATAERAQADEFKFQILFNHCPTIAVSVDITIGN